MIIIGVDYHPSDQYLALADTETGEYSARRLNHSAGEAEKFYRELAAAGVSVRVGMEATGYSRWFERLLAELGIEVWIGDAGEASDMNEEVAAQIDAKRPPVKIIIDRVTFENPVLASANSLPN